ncbi:UNVERIFIED_ORG: hypothetical protein M2348_001310 [Sphingomonas sp. R1F5B]
MSALAPFEVHKHHDGWRWHLIAACSRPLAYSTDAFPSDFAAAEAARAARADMALRAALVDADGEMAWA